MSDNFAESLWAEFAIETEEHIALIEPLLVSIENTAVAAADVAQLFRSFHSIKGLARAMDLLATEALAHEAENLLGLIREGGCPLDGPVVTLLLEAVDALKAMRVTAVEERRDVPPPSALIGRLAALYQQRLTGAGTGTDTDTDTGSTGSTDPGVSTPAGRDAAGSTDPKTGGAADTQFISDLYKDADRDAAGGEQAGLPFSHEDPGLLEYYRSLVGEYFPALLRALLPEADAPDARQALFEAADALAHASEMMEFGGLAEDLARLATLAAQEAHWSATDRRLVEHLMGEIHERLTPIRTPIPGPAGERTAGAEAASPDQILHGVLSGTVSRLLAELSDRLERLQRPADPAEAESDLDVAGDISRLARDLYAYQTFCAHDHAGRLILLIEDVFGRVGSGEMILNSELLALTVEALNAVGHTGGRIDLTAEAAVGLIDRFRVCLLDAVSRRAGGGPLSSVRRMLAGFDISPEIREVLSSENLWELAVAVRQGGNHFYEIRARLEHAEAFTTAFMSWLQAIGRPITNRTVFLGSETWFEFLVVSVHPEDRLRAELHRLDPDRSQTALRGCAPRSHPTAAYTTETAGTAGTAGVPPLDAGGGGDRAGDRTGDRAMAPTAAMAAAATAVGTTAAGPASEAPDGARRRDRGGSSGSNTLRVSSQAIDHLLNQVGETITLGNLMVQVACDLGTEDALGVLNELVSSGTMGDERTLAALRSALAVVGDSFRRLRTGSDKLTVVLDSLQEGALELRVVPIETLFNRFPRVVRDLAQTCGKRVRLDLEGGEVRIDKALIEALVDPLMHMVRNAVDHGIEPADERQARGKPPVGSLLLKATQRGNAVEILVRDDGRGLDRERIRRKALARGLIGEREAQTLADHQVDRLIFHAGFSTADALTATSGRGVGMDVVLANVTRLGGAIDVANHPGRGLTIRLRLPLSAAMQHALLVEVDGMTLAIPERFLSEIHECPAEAFQSVGGQQAILLRQVYLPVYHLGGLLGRPAAPAARRTGQRSIVVLANGSERIGIEVDQLQRRQELYVKEVHPRIAALPGISGATILGDGRVILILDGEDLFRLAERRADGLAGRPPAGVR